MGRFFQLRENHTTGRRELLAGLTTFAAMSYILAVNPLVLSKAGMDPAALVTATALAAAFMSALMALLTNYPIALAPGMGLNAFFTYTICLQQHVPWPAALGLVFYGGVLFFLLTISGLRRKVMEAIPLYFKQAVTCGIGLFIAFIGFQNGGLVAASPATLVTLGSFRNPETLLAALGLLTTAICVARRLPGAIIFNIAALTLVDLSLRRLGLMASPLTLPSSWIEWPASLRPLFLQLDLRWFWTHPGLALPLVFSLLFVDLFDNMGTLIGVCRRAHLLDENGNLPRIGRAFAADAGAAMIGSCLGTSTVTSYIESAAGVEAGGRTGLTALVAAACFLPALFLTPLILLVPPQATAPALVIVGLLMFQGAAQIPWHELHRAVPAFIAIIMMPLTFSITEGIALGLLADVVMKLGSGRRAEIPALEYGLAALFALHYVFR